MQSKETTVAGYLASLPEDRRIALEAVRKVILANLDPAYEEGMSYGHIGYYVPHRVYPAGYHCDPSLPLPYVALASQKNHMAVYMMCIYGHQEHAQWFQTEWARTGKKLDMGKSCIRFKKVENLALDVIGESIRRTPVKKYLAFVEASLGATRSRAQRPAAKRTRVAPSKGKSK